MHAIICNSISMKVYNSVFDYCNLIKVQSSKYLFHTFNILSHLFCKCLYKFILHCLHCTVFYTLFTVQCSTLCTLHSVLHFINCTVFYTLYTVQCSTICTLYSVLHYVHWAVFYTLYTVQSSTLCTFCTVQCSKL